MTAVRLRGMTWNHPRGYDPMIACSRVFEERTGIAIEWAKRSLQDFETYPVEELARAYDLIVIDHPHVGQITQQKCLLPLDIASREMEWQALKRGSVGASYASYNWQGRQWAFPIDAATQVQAFRPDLLPTPPSTFADVLAVARSGRMLMPLRSPHTLMTFFTLTANMGRPCARSVADDFVDIETGAMVYEMMRELVSLLDPACFEMDPIAVLEAMAGEGSKVACSPFIYGYVSYALAGFRPNRVQFCNIPAAGHKGLEGSALGGTGIAVSAFTPAPDEAMDFAYFVASGDVQKGLYAHSGGQPGHADAWEDDAVNGATADFYRATRRTLETAWVRPRHDGYMAFQQSASDRINIGLLGKEPAGAVIGELNRLYTGSLEKG